MKWTYEIINEWYICDMEIGLAKILTHILMYEAVFHLDYDSHGLFEFCQGLSSLDFVYISIEIVIWPITNHGHFWLGIFDCNHILEIDFHKRFESKIMIGDQVCLCESPNVMNASELELKWRTKISYFVYHCILRYCAPQINCASWGEREEVCYVCSTQAICEETFLAWPHKYRRLFFSEAGFAFRQNSTPTKKCLSSAGFWTGFGAWFAKARLDLVKARLDLLQKIQSKLMT